MTQTVCPSTVMEFGIDLGVSDTGSVVFSGKVAVQKGIRFCFCAKDHQDTTANG